MSGLDTEYLLDELVSGGVFAPKGDDTSMSLSRRFVSAVNESAEKESMTKTEEPFLELYPFIEDDHLGEILAEIATNDDTIKAILVELSTILRNKSEREQLGIIHAVTELYFSTEHKDGCPETFLSVRGDRLSTLTTLAGKSVVYVWRDDCNACELMMGELDDIFNQRESPLALYAVYGPNWVERLREEFAVGGGPTTLFMNRGKVDSRLIGAYTRNAIEAELELLVPE